MWVLGISILTTKGRQEQGYEGLGTHEHSLEAIKCKLLNSTSVPNLTFLKKV